MVVIFFIVNDICFIDVNINIVDQFYSYVVNFYVNGESSLLGVSMIVGFIYLNVSLIDWVNIFIWDEFVLWENYFYIIFWENIGGGFDFLDIVIDFIYCDEGLINNVEYCYVVWVQGIYNIFGVLDLFVNCL